MSNKIKTSWDLTPLLPENGENGFISERKKIEDANYDFINKWKDRTDYLSDPKILLEALDEKEKILRNFGEDGNEGLYWMLQGSLDENDPNIKARQTQISDFSKKIINDSHFFDLKLAKIDVENQKLFLKIFFKIYINFWMCRHPSAV